MTLIQRMACFKNSNLEFRLFLHQLIGGEDTTGACADDDNIVIHNNSPKHSRIQMIDMLVTVIIAYRE